MKILKERLRELAKIECCMCRAMISIDDAEDDIDNGLQYHIGDTGRVLCGYCSHSLGFDGGCVLDYDDKCPICGKIERNTLHK